MFYFRKSDFSLEEKLIPSAAGDIEVRNAAHFAPLFIAVVVCLYL